MHEQRTRAWSGRTDGRRLRCAAIAVALTSFPIVAHAQPAANERGRTSTPEAGTGRTLGGETFVEPTTFESVFVETQLGVRAGARAQRAAGVELAGRAFDSTLLGAHGGLDAAARITDRFGLRGSIDGTVLAGADVPSAIVGGANGTYAWRAGAVLVLLRSPKTGTQVGVTLGARGSSAHSVEPLRVATALYDRPVQTLQDIAAGRGKRVILASRSRTGAVLFVGAAQTIGSHVTVQGGLEGSVDRTEAEGWSTEQRAVVAEQGEEADVAVAVSVTADAGPVVPLAVQAEYRFVAPVAERERGLLDATAAHAVIAGAYYSGRRDLQLGVRGGALRLDSDVEHAEWVGEFSMRYSF